VLSKNKKLQDETDFWILMGFDHAWCILRSLWNLEI